MADGQANFYNFSNMHIDLSKVSASQTVLEVFPELRHHDAYVTASDIELRVAFLMCDPRGPFSTIKDYKSRLNNVFRFLKLKSETDDNVLYQNVLNLRSDSIANIWTVYLEQIFNHEWASWFSSSLIYYQMQTELRKPIDFKDEAQWKARNTIEARVDTVYKRMKSMEALVFVDEEIKRKAFEAEKGKIENYAERFADDGGVV